MQQVLFHLFLFSSILLFCIWLLVRYARYKKQLPPDDEDDGGGGSDGNLPPVDLPPDCSLDYLLTDRPPGRSPVKLGK